MSNSISIYIRKILSPYVEESAMDKASEAIVKFISDGFVRKELYKEKREAVNKLTDELTAVKEKLTTAEVKITEFSDEISVEKGELYKELASKTLKASGANPHFQDLLLNELCMLYNKYGKCDDVANTYASLDAHVDLLKKTYPYAFGEYSVKKAEIAANPIHLQIESNPWKRESVDLEEQIRLFRSNPTLARELAFSVGIRF